MYLCLNTVLVKRQSKKKPPPIFTSFQLLVSFTDYNVFYLCDFILVPACDLAGRKNTDEEIREVL